MNDFIGARARSRRVPPAPLEREPSHSARSLGWKTARRTCKQRTRQRERNAGLHLVASGVQHPRAGLRRDRSPVVAARSSCRFQPPPRSARRRRARSAASTTCPSRSARILVPAVSRSHHCPPIRPGRQHNRRTYRGTYRVQARSATAAHGPSLLHQQQQGAQMIARIGEHNQLPDDLDPGYAKRDSRIPRGPPRILRRLSPPRTETGHALSLTLWQDADALAAAETAMAQRSGPADGRISSRSHPQRPHRASRGRLLTHPRIRSRPSRRVTNTGGVMRLAAHRPSSPRPSPPPHSPRRWHQRGPGTATRRRASAKQRHSASRLCRIPISTPATHSRRARSADPAAGRSGAPAEVRRDQWAASRVRVQAAGCPRETAPQPSTATAARRPAAPSAEPPGCGPWHSRSVSVSPPFPPTGRANSRPHSTSPVQLRIRRARRRRSFESIPRRAALTGATLASAPPAASSSLC